MSGDQVCEASGWMTINAEDDYTFQIFDIDISKGGSNIQLLLGRDRNEITGSTVIYYDNDPDNFLHTTTRTSIPVHLIPGDYFMALFAQFPETNTSYMAKCPNGVKIKKGGGNYDFVVLYRDS
jgi:hypothetical protein